MKLIDHLDNKTKNKLIKMRRRKQSKKKRRNNMSNNMSKNITMSKNKTNKTNKDHLTEWDIKELMGINRDRYERRRGAVRRK